MKYVLIFVFCLIGVRSLVAQQPSAKQLQESAKTFLQQGDYESAIRNLELARQQEPNNIEVLKDLSFANYLKRDFARAIDIGKEIVDRPEADQQSFQILGLSYKAIAAYKECAKLYKTALKKFPNSGVIYNEYGELLAMDKNLDEAITQWEKGIEVDPNYSGNYYNATIYYSRSKNWIRSVVYGETFLNLESYSTRTDEVKPILSDAYTNLLAPSVTDQLLNARNTTAFEKKLAASLAKAAAGAKQTSGVENINNIRTRFIQDWVKENQQQYPYRLFDNQQYLLNEGLLEAYNYWLFSTAANADAYKAWQNAHPRELAGFKKMQESRVFKIPAGQYYFSR